jgi:hypothetical protein
MEPTTQSIIVQILVGVFTAGAIYGAIRADIKNLYARTEWNEKRADKAHERIDELLQHDAR